MLKIQTPATIAAADQQNLDKIPEDQRSAKWDKSRANSVRNFKTAVMTHGLEVQGYRCAWCTLPVGAAGRRTAHRDHIAPKALYQQWTFHAKNLLIACEYCNGFAIKADLDTVEALGADYDTTTFRIVHPYLDEPNGHISFLEQAGHEPGVVIQGLSPKGLWTIDKLQLTESGLTIERAKELVFYRGLNQLPMHFQELLLAATKRE
ncbi:HNH endonuclease [Cupriavidus sp. L7L]|uniref:HNH endonuclease n=1 Tax=Cupriavidus sp. L7L TaxID=2546443 RepID=UPI001055E302|nr:hypothetical protein [Cupriavidus sp. L7L]TDF62053.1 hypothetical protein E1J61_31635 [Cupriavidus sp. L7L]